MSRNDFPEIMRFIRFDKKSERSQRVRTNKFGMVSTVYKELREKKPCNKTINKFRFITTKKLSSKKL